MSTAPKGSKVTPRPVPERFLASKATLRFDRFMGWAIQAGGVSMIIAVFGIFIFIFAEIIPLFKGATVGKPENFPIGEKSAAVMGVDEWAEKPFIYDGNGKIVFAGLDSKREVQKVPVTLPGGAEPSALDIDPRTNRVTIGTKDGRIGAVKVLYTRGAGPDGAPVVSGSVKVEEFAPIGQTGKPLIQVACGDGGGAKVYAAIQDVDGVRKVQVNCIREKRGLMGSGKPALVGSFDLTPDIEGHPANVIASASGDSVFVSSDKGVVHYFYFPNGTSKELRQKFTPFAALPNPALSQMGFVFGDVSLILTSADGHQEVWSLYNQPVEKSGEKMEMRLFGKTKEFPKLEHAVAFYVASQRNKTFLCGYDNFATLRYTTTENVRWEGNLPFTVTHAAIDAKAAHMLFLDKEGTMHRLDVNDPHPEAGWKAFFGKVWYEGANKPEYTWQSTGGTDDFEPKLSLTPLIFGTMKGTLYAMLFAIPIALLAAIYSACFLPPEVKALVKPIMEVMASLPSVVLGFLAGLWLAPLIEDKVPSLLLVLCVVPFGIMLFGWGWTRLPVELRTKIRPGSEYLILLVPLVLLAWGAWSLGPWLEQHLFVVKDPATGKGLADFRLWWPYVTGATFDQRNSMVVGFMMGFAVVPIIFTISDDALSNVPPQLKAASLALGASRWQMVRTVVLPVASAGIFSALMIGLGRAVGETMIVVMATGNTPVMDWDIFSGMRTLSANIAVELPEAAVHSTHYRSLFLGAAVLFILTFVLNTAAELMRHRLRERFKVV